MKKIILLLLCAIGALISTAQTVNNAPVVMRNISLYFFDFYENGLNDWNAATAKTIPQNSLFAVRCCGGLVEVYSTTVPIYAGEKIITGNETQESFPMAPMNRIDSVIAKYHKIREVIVTNNQ